MFFFKTKCTTYALLTGEISILRSWGDDVVAEVIVNIIVYFGCFSRSVFEYAQ